MRTPCSLALVALFAGPAAAQLEVTRELLERTAERVAAGARAALAAPSEEPLGVRLVGAEELVAILAPEWLGHAAQIVGAEGEDPERDARELARRIAAVEADHVLARWAPALGEVVVRADRFDALAGSFGEPALASPAALEAALARETVRALLDRRLGLSERIAKTRQAEARQVYRAVVEGAVLHHARAVLADRPEARAALGRQLACSVRTLPREDPDQAFLERQLAVLRSSEAADGLEFVEGLTALGGEPALERALDRPPRDTLELARPDWYADPEARTDVVYDFEGVLDAWARAEDPARWIGNKISLTPQDVDRAFAALGPGVGARIRGNLEYTRVLFLGPPAPPEGRSHEQRSITVGLYGFHSPVDAADFVATNERLNRVNDGAMKSGVVRILHAEYEAAAGPGWKGFRSLKRIDAAGEEISAQVLYAAHGAQVLELILTGVDRPEKEIDAAVARIFGGLVQPRSVVEAREAALREGGAKSPEEGGR